MLENVSCVKWAAVTEKNEEATGKREHGQGRGRSDRKEGAATGKREQRQVRGNNDRKERAPT